jgi:hypothetical protein
MAVVALALVPAACGGGSKPATTPAATTTPTTRTAATTSTTTAQGTGPSPTATAAPAPSPTTTAAPAPQPSGGAAPAPPQAHAEIPALFTVAAGGALVPSSIGVPTAVPVDLTVVSRDGRAHTVVLRSPAPHTLKVPAGGRASVLVTGLRAGRYTVELDGSSRGVLVIGAQPGP